jgi:hypothetical protein
MSIFKYYKNTTLYNTGTNASMNLSRTNKIFILEKEIYGAGLPLGFIGNIK